MTTSSHTMIARRIGYDTERRGFVILAAGAVLVLLSMAASMASGHALEDATEQVQ